MKDVGFRTKVFRWEEGVGRRALAHVEGRGRKEGGRRQSDRWGHGGIGGAAGEAPETHARWSPCRPLRSHVPSFLSSIPSGHRYARLLYDLVLLVCLFWEPLPTFFSGPETQPLYLQCQAAWHVSVLD